jgi:hypothetical protein
VKVNLKTYKRFFLENCGGHRAQATDRSESLKDKSVVWQTGTLPSVPWVKMTL